MHDDSVGMWQYIRSIHAYLATSLIYGQIGIIQVRCYMNPAGFSIHAAASFITMNQAELGEDQIDYYFIYGETNEKTISMYKSLTL